MGRMEPLASAAFGREGRGVFYVADAPCGGRNIFRQRKGLRGRGGKPPGRLRRGEILCDPGKRKVGPFPAFCKKFVSCGRFCPCIQGWAPKGSRGRSESPLVASAEAKSSVIRERKVAPFPAFHKVAVSCGRFRPPAGGRGTFHHWKVPKGCRGRPKGACGVAAPGPPVAKQQCTASLAGARPAGVTSVPGRATVAFGAADPSPGSTAPGYPWSVGKVPPRQGPCAAGCASASVPCIVRARRGTRLVAGPRPNQMACPIRPLSVERQGDVPVAVQGGSGGIPRPFEGGIGGPGGHRGEVGIPPASLAGGASLQKKKPLAKPDICCSKYL